MPRLWKHVTRPTSLTLVVDNFDVKYVNKDSVNHLIKCLKEKYKLIKDWDGNLYCGIKLIWYYNNLTLDISMISMPGYIIKQIQKYKHAIPTKPQHCLYTPQPRQYGSNVQCLLRVDTSPPLSDANIKHIQWVIGSIWYYARAIDVTVLMAISTIANEQTQSTENTMQKTKQILDYLATHSDATVQFHELDMILNIHSDALYLSEAKRTQLSMWTLLHGMETQSHTANQTEWSFFHLVCNITVCCCIQHRGRTWCIILKLQISHNILTHP
jgi:hypothetical protein